MALYEVTLNEIYYGQQTVNRFNYESTGTTAAVTGSFGLAAALGALYDSTLMAYPQNTLLAGLANIQHVDVLMTGITVLSVYDPTDFYATPFVQAYRGNVQGEALAPFMALGFVSSQTNRDIRHGQKRFVGVSASDTVPGGGIEPGFIPLLNYVALKLGETATYTDEGQTVSYAPVIVSKERYPVPNKPGRFAYRYWEDPAVQATHTARSVIWSPYLAVRSQVSRQVGRGK